MRNELSPLSAIARRSSGLPTTTRPSAPGCLFPCRSISAASFPVIETALLSDVNCNTAAVPFIGTTVSFSQFSVENNSSLFTVESAKAAPSGEKTNSTDCGLVAGSTGMDLISRFAGFQILTLNRPLGFLSLKHAAISCGMGVLGRNNLLLTPEYGPHQRLCAVISEAPLAADPGRELTLCNDCGKSEQVCPSGALKAGRYNVDPCFVYWAYGFKKLPPDRFWKWPGYCQNAGSAFETARSPR